MQRRKPFSAKQKKQQLQQKKQRKRHKDVASSTVDEAPTEEGVVEKEEEEEPTVTHPVISKLHHQPVQLQEGQYDPNRFRLHFEQESREEIEKRKVSAKANILVPVDESTLEVSVEDIYQPGSVLDIPKRPVWSYKMSKAQVERQEESMFREYLEKIHSVYGHQNLSYFEHNLETWRQLWRVLELSDVILLITDIRHPVLHFSPALYTHVVDELKKQLVLVLNKVDLVPPQVAIAWRHYFLTQFPQLDVVCFTCYPNSEVSLEPSTKVRMRFRRKGGKVLSAVGPKELFSVIEKLYRDKFDVASIRQHFEQDYIPADRQPDPGSLEKDSMITIGLVGHPNVGKSSILNGITGKKCVSTSRTPGHTKHLQTILLTPTVRLCDCPGLVFPSLINKQLQILSGIYPIAQVREPYTSIGYLAERVPLVDLLQLTHPAEEEEEPLVTQGAASTIVHDWTAWDICDAWAQKKQYFTTRAARLDSYRAANHLLRLATDGRICLYFRPPGYSSMRESWEQHPEVSEMIELQQKGLPASSTTVLTSDESESEDDTLEEATLEAAGISIEQTNKYSALLDIGELESD